MVQNESAKRGWGPQGRSTDGAPSKDAAFLAVVRNYKGRVFGFSCFVLAVLTGVLVWLWREERAGTRWKAGMGGALVWVAIGFINWPGMFTIQKGITALVMPIGVVWMGSIGLTILLRRLNQRLAFWFSLAVVLFLTASANSTLTKAALSWLEGDFQSINALEEGNFEIVFVLGGGAGRGPGNQVNAGTSGDRVVLAARLYHAGLIRRLGCTGKSGAEPRNVDWDPAFLSLRLLRGLGVPEEAMIQLGGRNTKEEMREIKTYLGEHSIEGRVGVVTSSWHMRRAMRLATNVGLELIPLPADFRGGNVGWRDCSIVPDGHAFSQMGLAVKEVLAGLVGR